MLDKIGLNKSKKKCFGDSQMLTECTNCNTVDDCREYFTNNLNFTETDKNRPKYNIGDYVIFGSNTDDEYIRIGRVITVFKVRGNLDEYSWSHKSGEYVYKVRVSEMDEEVELNEYEIEDKYIRKQTKRAVE